MREAGYYFVKTREGIGVWEIGYYDLFDRWTIDGFDEGDDNDGEVIEVIEEKIKMPEDSVQGHKL